jgi:hypothetical protein
MIAMRAIDPTRLLVQKRDRGAKEDVGLERYELKYIVHPSRLAEIRDFIRPYTITDPNAGVDPPEYEVITLQLDSPDLALYRAKEHDALNRMKLRIRTYVTDVLSPVFLEIKRKLRGVIVKSRARIPLDVWSTAVRDCPRDPLSIRLAGEGTNYLQFLRLMQEIGARPVMRIRYTRESYLGIHDQYARLTIDRKLQYQPTRSWSVTDTNGRWWSMDSSLAQRRPWSGVILELKTFRDAPLWMVDLSKRFDLERVGFCKYFTAMRLESLFNGAMYSDASENCTYG